ncbi:hypothetical protein DFA_04386 [Cavenderia fasciculata]|uniref:Ankyrin repeat-containing protein n=1 Tax=Cavenderia fasciculata TaxID=261658 RepID=F4PPF5_CACFS|nr:uncharacterized protein DFA_04386 [Cavenderia fasciculata]EGG22268.1 hypothetical protein DFA_04386 [Cavenderia fasciculata]|eukprot:XP_004360119.1 hypothetical protein DFA_04386 [Cavenderia fasciculata]
MHFYTENSIDLACCSGRLDVVQLIISIHDPQNLPITKNAILNAMKAGSLELVQFLDTTFDSCNIAKTMIGSISKNSDVISYYLGKISIGGGSVDGLMILSSMDINLIKNHFHSTTTFINATTMLDFIKKATLFSPRSLDKFFVAELDLDQLSPVPNVAATADHQLASPVSPISIPLETLKLEQQDDDDDDEE